MKRFNLTEAAKDILNTNVAQKRAADHEKGVGNSQLNPGVGYGMKNAGDIGKSPEKKDDTLPDYTKGTPTATPPGATPPVGSEKDGVGITKPQGQPQETMGRADLANTDQEDADDFQTYANRTGSKLAPQMMQANPGATFQQYEGVDMSADVAALLEGESLSEEFKQKATTIFEAAVNSKVGQIAEAMQEELQEEFDSAVEQIKEEIAGKIDEYLSYMVNEWVEENEVAIEKGLRSELAEELLDGLYNLFKESYIDIPEEKVDVVEELATRVEELEDALNEEIEKNIAASQEINEHKKISAIHAACEGLTQTQVEKLKSLAEGVEFTTDEEFVEKLETIKESYFPTTIKSGSTLDLTEDVNFEENKKQTSGSTDPSVEAIAKTLSKTLKR